MDELAAYESRFRKAGLPLLIEDYSAREDIFTRALPLLTLVLVAELLGAIDLAWSLGANVAAVVGGIAVVLVAYGLLNVARSRPFLSRPKRVGTAELVAFVAIPSLLPVIFGLQTTSALVTALVNIAILLLVYLTIGFGLVSIVVWAATRLLDELANSLLLLAKALPLLMIFSVVLFLTLELWEVFSTLPVAFMVAVALLFILTGTVFLAVRLPREVRGLEHDAQVDAPPLKKLQRVNVGLVLFVSQALQVLIVAIGIGAFFIVFGALAISPETMVKWLDTPGNELISIPLFGDEVTITEELLRVAGAIAAFAGLYYAIAVLTDSTYREEFLEELTGEMRETFRDRADYLKLRATNA